MDTVEVRVENRELADEIVATIKAKAARKDATRAKTSEEWEFMEPMNDRWRSMSQCLVCTYEERKVFVAFKPWVDRPGVPRLRMSLHASHFNNFDHVNQWTDTLMGQTLGDAFRDETVLTRVDTAIDVLLPYETMKMLLDIPGCQRVDRYRSRDGGSILFGADDLKKTKAYSKKLLASRFD